MPQNEPLTAWVLRKTIADTAPNSRTRKRTVTTCTRLGKFAGLQDCDFVKLGGSYGIKSAKERTLPSDKDIEYWYGKITGERDRWVLGMMASFGVRPHEIFRIDLDAFRLNPWTECCPVV